MKRLRLPARPVTRRSATLALCAALLGAVACSPAPAGETQTIVIRIEHSRFEPAAIEVAAGSTVRFVVRNADPIDHELIVGDERVQSIHEKGTEAHHGAKPGEVSVPALATRGTTYTFNRPGTLLFGCHLPGHYAYGMKGLIRIR